jgi:hypothetical protein
VTLPERTETRIAYRPIPAECRSRVMPEYDLCLRTTYEDRCVPITSPVEVADTCTVLVPTCTRACAPVFGYDVVPDYEDRMEPVCAPQWEPVTQQVPVPVCGCTCGPCGQPTYGTVGVRYETRTCGATCRMKKVGERMVSVNVGSHLEQVQVSQGPVLVPTGSRPGVVVTGSHYEEVVVGSRPERVVVDQNVEYHQAGTRREDIVKRRCRLEAYEETVRVPAERAWVCDDPRHAHPGRVMSSAEYETLTGRRVP